MSVTNLDMQHWWNFPIPVWEESVSNISNIFPAVVSDLDPTATAFLICYSLDQAGDITILEMY